MSYTDNTAVKTYLNIDNTDDDTLLTALIARAQAIIDAYCGRTFEASQDATRYFDAIKDVDGAVLWLDKELAQITSITNGDGDVLATNEYVTEPRNETPKYAVRLLASTGLYWTYLTNPENAITVVGRWAYSVSAPTDIVHACIRLAAWLYRQRDTATGDFASPQQTQSGGYIMPARLPKDVEAVLMRYRKIS